MIELSETIENVKNIAKELKVDTNISELSSNLESGISKTIDKASTFIIKGLPIPDSAKDILIDVKNSLKTKDVKKIISTTVNSCLREGMEMLGISTKNIKEVLKFSDVVVKGGLGVGLKNALDVISEKYLKNNLIGNHVYCFFEKLKSFVESNTFIEKLKQALTTITKKKNEFLDKVSKWKEAYKNSDFDQVNVIAKNLNSKKSILNSSIECSKENSYIQNITKMLNNKNGKLSDIQLQLCSVL